MRRVGIFVLAIVSAVLLQTTVFAKTLFGVAPDLVLVVVISFALLEGPMAGATSGFFGGLLRDLLLNAPKGLTGLSYLLVGYAVGRIRPYVQSMSVFVPIAAIFLGSVAGTGLYEILQGLLGQQTVSWAMGARVVVLTAVYNTLLAPLVYPVIRRIVGLYQTEKVYRW